MMQLQYGRDITSVSEQLQKVPLERLYQGIRHPKQALSNQVERLRLLRAVDEREYSRLKRGLPYFVCGHFHPAFRRKEHFSSIESFVIDLDHFEGSGLEQEAVAERLRADERVLMLFTSPSGDGLKVMFRLAEKCFDAGLYSYFYKAFLQQLAAQYELQAVVDLRTHDVSRACFLSVDPKAHFHAGALPIVLEDYFDRNAPDADRAVREGARELEQAKSGQDAPKRGKGEGPTDEVLDRIKRRLNPQYRPNRAKAAPYVPTEVEEVVPQIREVLAAEGIELQAAEPIQYGKRLRLAAGAHLAEVNLFYGKSGFSIVKTTKTGTSPELAQLAYQLIGGLLYPEP